MSNVKEKDSILFTALKDLDAQMTKENLPPVNLKVIGGFALLCHEVRKNLDAYTDIDYIGPELSARVKELSESIGIKYNLGTHWLNNDFLLTGNTLEDIEFSTGKLHFRDSYRLNRITLEILSKTDLLKLKIIAIDTALSSVGCEDALSRYKDLFDINLLVNDLGINLKQFTQKLDSQNLVINPNTYKVINTFIKYGEKEALNLIEDIREEDRLLYDSDIDENLDKDDDSLAAEFASTFNLPIPEDVCYE